MNESSIKRTRLAVWLQAFGRAMASATPGEVTALFAEECFWRDQLAFTWDLQTLEGRDAIEAMLEATLLSTRPGGWHVVEPVQQDACEGPISFETALGRCDGYVRLDSDGRCQTFLSSLRELKYFEEARGSRRWLGLELPGQTWNEPRDPEKSALQMAEQPYVLIVGGGHCGLGLAARLKMLGVPALVVDRHVRPGDSWRMRYASLHLHDPVWANHMPYLPFPEHWPVFASKDQIAEWLESYVRIMEIDIWTSAECVGASYDGSSADWRVRILCGGREIVLRPKHLVLATGLTGEPQIPRIPGADIFAGEQHHSTAHPGGAGFEGRKVVVIGSNNSAHDICADLFHHGADVTMIQRSSTHVVRVQRLLEFLQPCYSEEAFARGISVERADLMLAATPLRMMPKLLQPWIEKITREDAALYQGLADVGFKCDFGADRTGIFGKAMRKLGGYYIDTGASELIVDKSIKLRSGVEVSHLDRSGMVLSDGSRLDADCIVYATGFQPFQQWLAKLISPDVARRIGRVWGYGAGIEGDPGPWEGELRNIAKPTKQPGLWIHGGSFQWARSRSLLLALQLKARFERLAIQIYQAR